MKIYFVANNQLPTMKAHGLQIIKMCEAFVLGGVECELLIPDRHIDPSIKENDPLKFYGVKTPFKITRLKSLDFIKLSGFLGKIKLNFLTKLMFGLQQLSFARSAKKYIGETKVIIYSRDQFSIHGLLNSKHKIYWEVHNFPKNINSRFYKKILNRIDGLLVISKGLKKDLEKYYKKEILNVPDAVDIEEFDINISKTEARNKLNLPVDKKIVAYVGHLYPWKNVDSLAKAVEFVRDDTIILIVGGLEKDRERIKEYISNKNLERVIFKKYITHEKVPLYLKASDCLILTGSELTPIAEKYTSPLKLFEYMASKRPIVAQSLPSFREILNSDNAILAEPENPKDLGEKIDLILNNNNLADTISSNAFSDVQRYTWIKRAKRIIDFIN